MLKKEYVKSPVINIQNTIINPGENQVIRLNVGRLPSDTRIHMHVHVFRAEKPGPTMLVLAGVHGDEINGVESFKDDEFSSIPLALNYFKVVIKKKVFPKKYIPEGTPRKGWRKYGEKIKTPIRKNNLNFITSTFI